LTKVNMRQIQLAICCKLGTKFTSLTRTRL